MKSKPHQSKKKHSFQPSGRSSVEKTKQPATTNEERIPNKKDESKDAAEKAGRAPKEELDEGLSSRDNGVILPKLIESDGDDETEDEKEDLNEKPEYGINARTTAQNTPTSLRYGKPTEEGKEKRDMINEYNINFSIFKSPKNAIEGDILVH